MNKICKKHGNVKHYLVGLGKNQRARCSVCSIEAVTKRRQRVKQILVAESGGRCIICGYNKCIRALEFHHLDPNKKDFSIGVDGQTRGLDRLRGEVKKCILVCSNCHCEIHSGLIEIKDDQ